MMDQVVHAVIMLVTTVGVMMTFGGYARRDKTLFVYGYMLFAAGCIGETFARPIFENRGVTVGVMLMLAALHFGGAFFVRNYNQMLWFMLMINAAVFMVVAIEAVCVHQHGSAIIHF